jgi:hypothetical protein
VFAYPGELDDWLKRQGLRTRSNPPSGPKSDTAYSAESDFRASIWRRPRLLAISGIAVVVGSSILAIFLFRSRTRVAIGEVRFAGQQLLAMSNGRVVWSYDFGQPLRDVTPVDAALKVQIQDMKGDGSKEVMVAAPLLVFERGNLSTDALYCFSSRGKLLWHHAFADHVPFGGEDAGPRWEIYRIMVTGKGSARALWCTICSFPTAVSVLVKIDASGHVTRQFVNFGHLRPLNEMRTPGGRYILVGGINNEYDCAALAVIKESEASGRSPQTGELSDCQGCPAGHPHRYYLFPRSEVSRIVGPAYNSVFEILVNQGPFQVMTTEVSGPSPPADWALYDFSRDNMPTSIKFSDHYWLDHARLSAAGKIKHSVRECPERLKSVTVHEWTPDHGWKNIKLPPIMSNPRGREYRERSAGSLPKG